MPPRELTTEDAQGVLAGQQVVRVAFGAEDRSLLIALGYVLVRSSLWRHPEGLKTDLASADPRVAFQVDTSAVTGLFEWRSVTGRGLFSLVESDGERQAALNALAVVIEQAPEWWQREQAEHMASGVLVVWKIVPTEIFGRAYEPS